MEDYSYAVDVVGVFDSSFAQVFPQARPLKATVRPSAKLMDHPVESGGSITDHRVILPTEIELTLILSHAEFRDTYGQIEQRFLDTETLVVQTSMGSYPDMVIEAMPHDEVGGDVGMVAMNLKFREVILVTAQFQALPPAAVDQPATGEKGKRNASTVKRGEQTGRTETAPTTGGQKKSSTLYDVFYGKKSTPGGG